MSIVGGTRRLSSVRIAQVVSSISSVSHILSVSLVHIITNMILMTFIFWC